MKSKALKLRVWSVSLGALVLFTAAVGVLWAATPVSIVSIQIDGPDALLENSQATYVASVKYSDGRTRQVIARWRDNAPYCTIDNGVLTAGEVNGDQTVTLVAYFLSSRIRVTGTKRVTVLEAPTTGSHLQRLAAFVPYEGTKTCLKCHTDEALQVHASAHYQWKGDTPDLVDWNGGRAGKLGGINDFCIYPDVNWIGKMTNLDGAQVDGGCSKCHAGLGQKPTEEVSQVQLENIDCLVCHSDPYRRKVADDGAGGYKYVPDTTAMGITALQAAVNITLPGRDACLNCHTKAGGGNNFKRGDIEEQHRNCDFNFDVHMASNGGNMVCTACHVTDEHRIAGRGSDLRETDLATKVACTNCHPAAPHDSSRLNQHVARVNCTTCHIPFFAKVAATDMLRDWSAPGDVDEAKRLYDPHMLRETNAIPEYRFWNGKSTMYQFGTAALPGPDGAVVMSQPVGSVQEAGAKIYAFKRHMGVQPIDSQNRLLPLKIGIFFQTNDFDTAVQKGVEAVGWTYTGHQFAQTERFMGLFHEVSPAEQALQCTNCHTGNRLDFSALGYDPKEVRNGELLCVSCHEYKEGADEWRQQGDYTYFRKLHEKHVTDKRFNCNQCHEFSTAQ